MPERLRSVDELKALAKRLRRLSERASSEVLPRLGTPDARERVAAMLGYSGWREAVAEHVGSQPPDERDERLSLEGASARRRQQAQRISAALGLGEPEALALVEVLLPTGDRSEEIRRLADIEARPVDELHGKTAEHLGLYLSEGWYREALGDVLISHGMGASDSEVRWAHRVLTEKMRLGFDPSDVRRRRRGVEGKGIGARGYAALIAPGQNFYQGMFVSDFGVESRRDTLARIRRQFEASGMSGDDHAVSGALQATVASEMLEGQGESLRVGVCLDALGDVVGHPYFAIIVRSRDAFGFSTDIEVWRDVEDEHAARRKFAAHPEVVGAQFRAFLSEAAR